MRMTSVLPGEMPGATEWPAVPADHAIPMQSHAWMLARAGLVGGRLPRLLAVRDDTGLRAIAPLVEIGGWLRELPAMFEPSDLVWRDTDGLQALARILAGQPLPLCVDRLPADSPTLTALRKAYGRRGLVLTRPAMPTPYIALEDSAGDIDAILGARRRADLRRAARRAACHGTVNCEIHNPAAGAELDALIGEAYGIETRSWKFGAGTALTADAIQGTFFAGFARDAARAGWLRIALLRIDGRAVAMQIAAEWQQRFWLFKMSFDRAYADCSPGQLLLHHTLAHAAMRRLRSYEFMGVMDDWTRLWTPTCRRYLQVRAIPFSGTTARMALRRGLGTVRRRLRALLP